MKKGQTTLIKCTCKSEFQDERYDGKRVANMRQGKNLNLAAPSYRCTVCGRET